MHLIHRCRNRLPIVLLFVLGAVAGCGSTTNDVPSATGSVDVGGDSTSGGDSASGGATVSKPRVALIMKSLANEFFKTMSDGAEAHQKAHSGQYELVANGIPDERNLARQVALVEEMIAQGVDAIVIAPADSSALVPVCRRAQDAGIVVVNIDNKFDAEVLKQAGATIPFVGPDNRAGAKMVGDHLAAMLEPDAPVAILEGVQTAFNGQQRKAGFEDAVKARGLRLVDAQSAEWEMSVANTVASAMLSEHPEIQALLCCNDSMAMGALAAVKSAGRGGEVLIVGFDNVSAVQQAIRDGHIVATADQHGDQLAVFGIEFALQVLAGTTPENRQTPVDLITIESFTQNGRTGSGESNSGESNSGESNSGNADE